MSKTEGLLGFVLCYCLNKTVSQGQTWHLEEDNQRRSSLRTAFLYPFSEVPLTEPAL